MTQNLITQRKQRRQGFFITRTGKKLEKLGRPKGAKDKSPNGRKNSGYYQRWVEKKCKKSTPRILTENMS